MQWGEAQGTWLGVIGTNQHSLWSSKRGQWSKPRGDEVEVNEWDLALGTDHDRFQVPPKCNLLLLQEHPLK